MSTWQSGDLEETQKQLINPVPFSNGRSWLRTMKTRRLV